MEIEFRETNQDDSLIISNLCPDGDIMIANNDINLKQLMFWDGNTGKLSLIKPRLLPGFIYKWLIKKLLYIDMKPIKGSVWWTT